MISPALAGRILSAFIVLMALALMHFLLSEQFDQAALAAGFVVVIAVMKAVFRI